MEIIGIGLESLGLPNLVNPSNFLSYVLSYVLSVSEKVSVGKSAKTKGRSFTPPSPPEFLTPALHAA